MAIQTYFEERFNLKKNDFNKIKLLFLYSFFLGLFIAFYFVPANSNFLSNYGHYELPYAYVVSGLVGVIAITFYSSIQRKHKTKTLFISAVVFILTISLFERLLLFVLEQNYFDLDVHLQHRLIKYLSFFVFVWAWPFIALVATITGGLALRLFNLLQVKKFYGLINIGGVLAAIISYFTISQLLRILSSEYDLILIGSVGLVGALVLLVYIYKKFPEKKTESSEKIVPDKKWQTFALLKNKFILFIFIAASISAIVVYITDFGFLVTVKANKDILFGSDKGVATFISFVYGGLKVGEFIISLLSGRILTKGGVRLGLTLLPVTIAFLFIFAYIDAVSYGKITLIFVGFITAAKILERVVRRGVDDPAFNVLYQTMPDEKKLFIQTRVGVVQQISIALAGLILIFLNILLKAKEDNFKLELYPLYASIILLFAIFIAFKLYRKYKERIKEILEEKRLFDFEYKEKDIFANDSLKMFILSEDIDASKLSTIVLAETNPRSLETFAGFLLQMDDSIIRKSVLSNIDSTYNEKVVPIIEQVGDSINFKNRELKKLFLEAFFKLDYSEIDFVTIDDVKKLAYSDLVQKKITATKYLFRNEFLDDEKIILHLLKCDDKSVKIAAIKIAGKRKNKTLHKELINFLNDKEYNNLVISILVEIGEKVIVDLNSFFLKQTEHDVIVKILQIYAKIGTPKAQRFLVSNLNYPNMEVQHLVILSLQYSGFRAKEENIDLIRKKIRKVVENIVWFMVSIKDLVREKNTLKLIQALDLERQNSLEELFVLLSFTQSADIVDLIRTNIIGENTIFALELIDNFIEPEIKKIILPLFEPISLGQKIKKFKQYFYQKPVGFENRLINIITADSSKVDIWSQSKAVELLSKSVDKVAFEKIDFDKLNISEPKEWTASSIERITSSFENISTAEAILISLFHPSKLIYSTAIKTLREYENNNIEKFINKLSNSKRKVYFNINNNEHIIIDKIKTLRRAYLFYAIPEKSLVKLADIVTEVKLKPHDNISFIFNEQEFILILLRGKLFFNQKKTKQIFKKNSVLIKGLNVPKKVENLTAETNSLVMVVNRFEFFNLLALNNNIVLNLFKTIEF